MIHRNNKFIITFCLIFTTFYILFDWIRFDISLMIDSIGFKLTLGIILLLLMGLYIIVFLIAMVLLFKNFRTNKIKATMPAISCLVVLLYFFVINNSSVYLELDYKVHYNNRATVLQRYEEGNLQQVNVDKYIVSHRLISHNKIVYIQNKGGIVKAMFYISNGFNKDRVLVYASDDSGIEPRDFSFGISTYGESFSSIKKIDEKWYSATIKQQ